VTTITGADFRQRAQHGIGKNLREASTELVTKMVTNQRIPTGPQGGWWE